MKRAIRLQKYDVLSIHIIAVMTNIKWKDSLISDKMTFC